MLDRDLNVTERIIPDFIRRRPSSIYDIQRELREVQISEVEGGVAIVTLCQKGLIRIENNLVTVVSA